MEKTHRNLSVDVEILTTKQKLFSRSGGKLLRCNKVYLVDINNAYQYLVSSPSRFYFLVPLQLTQWTHVIRSGL